LADIAPFDLLQRDRRCGPLFMVGKSRHPQAARVRRDIGAAAGLPRAVVATSVICGEIDYGDSAQKNSPRVAALLFCFGADDFGYQLTSQKQLSSKHRVKIRGRSSFTTISPSCIESWAN